MTGRRKPFWPVWLGWLRPVLGSPTGADLRVICSPFGGEGRQGCAARALPSNSGAARPDQQSQPARVRCQGRIGKRPGGGKQLLAGEQRAGSQRQGARRCQGPALEGRVRPKCDGDTTRGRAASVGGKCRNLPCAGAGGGGTTHRVSPAAARAGLAGCGWAHTAAAPGFGAPAPGNRKKKARAQPCGVGDVRGGCAGGACRKCLAIPYGSARAHLTSPSLTSRGHPHTHLGQWEAWSKGK